LAKVTKCIKKKQNQGTAEVTLSVRGRTTREGEKRFDTQRIKRPGFRHRNLAATLEVGKKRQGVFNKINVGEHSEIKENQGYRRTHETN